MTDTKPSAARGSPSRDNSDEADHRIGGSDIANLLQSKGPVVKCVVLRAPRQDQNTTKESLILEDLVEELEIDTTPAKNEVEKVLDGPITFIGQYDEGEGIVLMARRGLVANTEDSEEYESMSVGRLRAKCKERSISTDTMIEKQDLVDALRDKEKTLPPLNLHTLHPPLHKIKVRGDILILKVAEVDDESLDEGDVHAEDAIDEGKVDDDTGRGETRETERDELSQRCDSGDFFLSYSKQEYLKFAARTDIVAQHPPNSEDVDGNAIDNEDSNSDNGDEEEEDDGDFQPAEDMDEMTEEEEKSAMLNIVMSELLRKFRSDNGRGAASREVLEIRASVAEQIGIEVVTYNESQQAAEENKGEESGQKRSTGGDEIQNGGPARKKVKFNGTETAVEDEQGEEKRPSVASGAQQEDQEKRS